MGSGGSEVFEGFLRAVRRQRPRRVPVVFCISSQYICRRFGVAVRDYLYDPEVKLQVQCAFQDAYPEAMLVPGIYPDFGCGVVEPSAFGCRLVQREDNPLAPEPVCPQALQAQPGDRGIEDALRLEVPKAGRDGLMPQVLEQYRYFWKHLDRRYIERYGYLEGFAFAMGPVETAALVVGYENFLMGLVDHPEAVHRLLGRATELTLEWLRAQEKLNGTLRRIYLFDHTPARVGPAHFEEFVFPYLARVCREFASALKIYHICDRQIAHVLPRLPDLGIDVLYFAADIAEVKAATGGRVSLMGNLSPIDLFLQGTPGGVAAEAARCIEIAAEAQGGYLLAPGGAFIPGTPEENIRAVFAAVDQRPR
ncbi:MAG: uroporphyrinogen decarboxylase family protein [Spirochaetales bacterium]|nr:uroporphyrinogen decarboxylase family protein [Spirochaetales bacterium]